eukprot:TRINITY_DN4559_c0_g1_i2.p1 TRINITY_DN4559_c0_g1~~TRINITY_DN4559_c0_g1_i2.p1  ORF type:complete len:104 (+),score=5.09 TRINITY_DN4559_c0_g1_i2:337-648(+)
MSSETGFESGSGSKNSAHLWCRHPSDVSSCNSVRIPAGTFARGSVSDSSVLLICSTAMNAAAATSPHGLLCRSSRFKVVLTSRALASAVAPRSPILLLNRYSS